MSKRTLEQRRAELAKKLAEADEYQIHCIEAGLTAEIDFGLELLEMVDKRLEYLEFIHPTNCIKRARSLES